MTFSMWPEHPIWSWTLSRVIGEAVYGGGEFNEIYRAAERITPGDGESWYNAFAPLARRTATLGEEAETAGRTVSARERLLRACNYHRWSEAFLSHDDPRRSVAFDAALAAFRKAAATFSPPVERVSIPFEGETLPGYLFHAPTGPGPVLISIAGADVYKEALYFLGGAAALARGLSVLVFDGPGQGEPRRYKGSPIRPDYEVVLTAAIDYLESRSDVDSRRIGVMGRSFAGYYLARALAFEQRPRAAVIFGAFYDAVEVFDFFPPLRQQFRFLLGAADLEQTRRTLRSYTLSGLLNRVTTPTLILHGEDDFLVPVSHAHRTHAELGGEKGLHIFPSGCPGAHHCQHDTLPEVFPLICDWLVERLAIP